MAGQIDAVVIDIKAINNAKAAFDDAIRQVSALQTASQRSGKVIQANFKDFAGVVGSISPAAAQATAQISNITSATAGLGPAAFVVVGLTATVVGLAAAYRSAFEEVKKLASSAEEIDNLRQRTNLAADAVIAFKAGFEDSGVGAEALGVSMKFLNKAIAEGNSSLKTLGITTVDTRQALDQLADVFATLPDGPTKTRLATDVLGKSGESLIPVLNRGSAGLRAFEAAAVAAGITVGTGPLSRLAGLDNQFDALGRSIEGVKLELAVALAPAIEASLPLLRQLADAAADTVLRLTYMAAALERLKSGDISGSFTIGRHGDDMVKAFSDARDAARDLAAEAAKAPPKTIIQLMGEQGRLTRDTLQGLLKLSDQVLEKLGTTRGIIKLQLETGTAEGKAKKIKDEIGELAKTMGITRDEATRLSATLASLGRESRAASIRNQLDEARKGAEDVRDALLAIPLGLPGGAAFRDALTKNLKEAAAEAEKTRKAITSISDLTATPEIEVQGILEARKGLDDVLEAYEKIGRLPPLEVRRQVREEKTRREIDLIGDPEAMEEVRDRWKIAIADITSFAGLMRDGVQTSFDGTVAALNVVQNQILAGGNIFKLRGIDIFRGFVDGVLAQLNRLIASQAIKFLFKILGLIGGNPAAVVASEIVGGAAGGGGGPTGNILPPALAQQPAPSRLVVQTSQVRAGLATSPPAAPFPVVISQIRQPAFAAAVQARPAAALASRAPASERGGVELGLRRLERLLVQLGEALERQPRDGVRVNRRDFLDLVAGAISEKDRRRALAQGF